MKKILLVILFFLSSRSIFSQINYTFSAHTIPFSLLTGETVAPITAAFSPTKTALDEGFSNNIPIGFSFQYNGVNYSTIHLNTNGFACFGSPFLSSNTNPEYHINELTNPVGYKGAIRPIIAPSWDDLILTSASDLSYKTEGVAPDRIFTAQWKNAIWQSGTAAITFQIKLQETSNIVSFHYQQEAGAIGANPSASIGITSDKNSMPDLDVDLPYFLSLNSSANSATASDVFETATIDSKPVSDQEFRFTPIDCAAPADIKLINYNSNSATISWIMKNAGTNYQIAVSNIDVQPNAGSVVNTNSFTFNNLASNTEYFFFIKNDCGSPWARFKFKTTLLVSLPFTENFESSLDGSLPTYFTSQNNGSNFAEMKWQTTDLLASPAGSTGAKKAINSSRFSVANSWLFTPSFTFLSGATYNLIFKYSTTAATNIGARPSAVTALGLQVKYGLKAGTTAMLNSIATINNIANTSFSTQNFSFVPSASGEYNIGFGYQADVSDALILLDDISLVQTSAPLPLNLLSFEAKLNSENLVELSWQTTAELNISHFELERSLDNKAFEQFGKTNANNNNNLEKNNYEYYDRKPANGHNYYRLKMLDLDGKFSYSPTRFVNLKENFVTLLYPNPSGKDVFLKLQNAANAKIKVFSVDGKEQSTLSQIISDNELKISLLESQPLGIYLVNIITDTETRILKWMVR